MYTCHRTITSYVIKDSEVKASNIFSVVFQKTFQYTICTSLTSTWESQLHISEEAEQYNFSYVSVSQVHLPSVPHTPMLVPALNN